MGIAPAQPGPTGPAGPAGPDGAAVPDYVAIGTDATFDLADWTDAAAVGGPDSADKALLGGGAVLAMPINRKADGSPITGVRAQALLTPVAAGDFCVGFALAYQAGVAFAATQGYRINAGAVFVDGPDASTSDWFGVLAEWPGSSVATGGTLYSEQNQSGAGNQFATYTGFSAVAAALQPGQTAFTVWLVRSAATLSAYFGRYGEIPTLVATWTVSSAAGMVGPRTQITLAVVEDVVSLQVMRFSHAASAALPWLP